jgi:hypothetical protein
MAFISMLADASSAQGFSPTQWAVVMMTLYLVYNVR